MQIEFIKELVTPSMAEKYLQSNISNRRIKEKVVVQYANDMKNGRWKDDTAEAIKISKSGIILDGQHRLEAVKKANIPIYFLIAKGLNDDVFDVLDTGSSRNAADVFKIQGIKHENIIPSIITTYNSLGYGKRMKVSAINKSTNAMLLEQYEEEEEFWQKVAIKTLGWYRNFAKILPPSIIGGFYAATYRINENNAQKFMNQLCTGVDIQNSVIILLRDKLMRDKLSQRKMPTNIKMALIIKSWDFFQKGKEVKLLKFNEEQEEFPSLKNEK